MPTTYDWDPVDEASDQSFPASDPPSHGVPTDPIARRLSKKRVGIAVAIAGALIGAIFLVRRLRA